MDIRLYTIDTYLGESESYHFARKRLRNDPMLFAHTHDYYEVFLVVDGQIDHWINARRERLGTGSLVFMRPGDAHALAAAGGPTAQIINIMFRRHSADHLIGRYGDDLEGQFFWNRAAHPATYVLEGPRFERAVNISMELQTTLRTLARIEEYLLTLMTRTVDIAQTAGQAMPGWMMRACAMARRPEILRGGPRAFVEVAGRGHEHVCRVAQQYLGMTPSRYINTLRMEQAALMLASDDTPIPDIAAACGIDNLSHFYRVFRRHYGVTPKAYRAQHARSPV